MTDKDLDVLVYVSRMLREIDNRVRSGYAGDQDPEIAAIFMAARSPREASQERRT